MSFCHSAIGVLQTLMIALGAGLAIWGAIHLLEGYGNDNPGANAQGSQGNRDKHPMDSNLYKQGCRQGKTIYLPCLPYSMQGAYK